MVWMNKSHEIPWDLLWQNADLQTCGNNSTTVHERVCQSRRQWLQMVLNNATSSCCIKEWCSVPWQCGAQCHCQPTPSCQVSNSSLPPLHLQLKYCVPQGSVLGPILFILYTTPLSNIIANHTVNFSRMIHSSRNPLLLVEWPTHQRTQCMHR